MFPENPNLLEEYVKTKADEIKSEVESVSKYSTGIKLNTAMLAIPVVIIALAVFLMIIL